MTPPWPSPPLRSSRKWPALFLGTIATLLGAAALTGALIRTGASSTPEYTAAQKAEAKRELCEQFHLAMQSIVIETNPPSDDAALARISETNGASLIEIAAANPALDLEYRDAARALAAHYRKVTALATLGNSPTVQSEIKETNSTESTIRESCAR